MILYFDTSALIKRYINETGSSKVDELMDSAKMVFVSVIAEIEALSAFRRLLEEKAIGRSDFNNLKNELETDFKYFEVIELDKDLTAEAKRLIEKYKIKTLDSIQLASVYLIKEDINNFVVCDKTLLKCALKEGIKAINPEEEE